MRLIDADELMKNRVENDPVRIAAKCAPTAYDVDKVVERLEELREMVPVNRLLDDIIKDKPKELGQLMAYKKTIEIVKSGGMESLNEGGEHMEKSILVIDTPINCTECPLEFDIGDTSGKTLLNANLCRGCGKRNMDSKTKPAWCPLLPYSEA